MKKTIFFLMCLTVSVAVSAQSSCDNLFSSGVKFQQTMTIGSQNQAISYFQKAKACYDSQAKKDLCDQQIKACRNIIDQINKYNEAAANPAPEGTRDTVVVEVAPDPKETVKDDVELSLDQAYVRFKGKGDEFKKVKVDCNYEEWNVEEKPDWVSCSKNENDEIVIEAESNPFKEERSGTIVIECYGKVVSLTVIQEKVKKLGII